MRVVTEIYRPRSAADGHDNVMAAGYRRHASVRLTTELVDTAQIDRYTIRKYVRRAAINGRSIRQHRLHQPALSGCPSA